MTDFDFKGEAEKQKEPTDQGLVNYLRELCVEAVDLEEAIKGYDDALKAAKKRQAEIHNFKIPEAMASAGVGSLFSLDTGEVFEITERIFGGLPKGAGERIEAIQELERLEAEDLIKVDLKTKFNKGEREQAEEAALALRKMGLEVEVDESVHPQTLWSFVREALRDGTEIDTEKLGVFVGQTTKIKRPKK